MDKDYIRELFEYQKRAVSADARVAQEGENIGYLTFFVTTLKGILPIEAARVTVFDELGKEIAFAVTDSSGKTESFALAAKPRAQSLESSDDKSPYSLYSAKIHADGYTEQIINNIPVFSGVTSLKRVNLVSLSSSGKDKGPGVTNDMPDYHL